MVADYDNCSRSWSCIVRGTDRTPHLRLSPQSAEIIARHQTCRCQDRRSIGQCAVVRGWTPYADLVGKTAVGRDALKWTGICLKLASEIPWELVEKAKI